MRPQKAVSREEQIVRDLVQRIREEIEAERNALLKVLCRCFPSYLGHDSVYVETPYGTLHFSVRMEVFTDEIQQALPYDYGDVEHDLEEKCRRLKKLQREDFGGS